MKAAPVAPVFTTPVEKKNVVASVPVVRLPVEEIAAIVERKLAPFRASDTRLARIAEAAMEQEAATVGLPTGYSQAVLTLETFGRETRSKIRP
jgi:hypothetical protein